MQVRLYVISNLVGAQTMTLEITFDFNNNRVSRTVNADRVLTQNQQQVWFGTVTVPEDEGLYLMSTSNTNLTRLSLTSIIPTREDHAPLAHHFQGELSLSQNLNVFVVSGEFVENLEVVAQGQQFGLQNQIFEGLLTLTGFLMDHGSNEGSSALTDLRQKIQQISLNQRVPFMESGHCRALNQAINLKNPSTFAELDNHLAPILVLDIPQLEEESDERKTLLNTFDQYSRLLIQLFVELLKSWSTDQIVPKHFICQLIKLTSVPPEKGSTNTHQKGNLIVSLLKAAVKDKALKDCPKQNILSFFETILKALFNDGFKFDNESWVLLQEFKTGTNLYEIRHCADQKEFLDIISSCNRHQRFTENEQNQIRLAYIELFKREEFIRLLNTERGLIDSMEAILKLPPNLLPLFVNNNLQYKAFLNAIINFCSPKVRISPEFIYAFLSKIARNVSDRSPLADILFEMTHFEASEQLFLDILKATSKMDQKTAEIQRAFNILPKELFNNEKINRLFEAISEAKDYYEVSEVIYTYLGWNKLAFRSIEKFPLLLEIKDQKAIENLIHYIINLYTKKDESLYFGAFEWVLNKLEAWAWSHQSNSQALILRLLRDENFMAKYYVEGNYENFLQKTFRDRNYHVLNDYFYMFGSKEFLKSDRIQKNKQVFSMTFNNLLSGEMGIRDFLKYAGSRNEFDLLAVYLVCEDHKNFNDISIFVKDQSNLKQLRKAKYQEYGLFMFGSVGQNWDAERIKQFESLIGDSDFGSSFNNHKSWLRFGNSTFKNMEISEDDFGLDTEEQISYYDGFHEQEKHTTDIVPTYLIKGVDLFGNYRLGPIRERFDIKKTQLETLISVIMQYCPDCQDRETVLSSLLKFVNPNSSESVKSMLNDDNSNYLWNQHKSLKRLLSNFRYVFDLHKDKTIREHEKVADRVKAVQTIFDKLRERIALFRNKFEEKTAAEIESLYGNNNFNNIFDSICDDFNTKNEKENLMIKVIYFVLERTKMSLFFDLFKLFSGALKFRINRLPENLKLISSLEALSKNDSLKLYASLITAMEQNLVCINKVNEVNSKLRIYLDLPRSLDFIDASRDQYEFLKEFTTEIEGFDINWQDIDDLELIDDFYKKWVNRGETYHNLEDIIAEKDALRKSVPAFENIERKMEHNFKLYHNLVKYKTEINKNSDTKLSWIQKLMKNSTITLKFNKQTMVECLVHTDTGDQKSTADYNNLREIRNIIKTKSMVLEDVSSAEAHDQKNMFVINFMTLFRCLESMKHSQESLVSMGYVFDVQENFSFHVVDGSLEECQRLTNKFELQASNFVKDLKDAYRNSYLGTFLYGDLINVFHKMFLKPTLQAVDSAYMQYLGLPSERAENDLYQRLYDNSHKETKQVAVIFFVGQELAKNSIYNVNNNLIGERQLSTQKIFVSLNESNNVFKKIMNISWLSNKRLPLAHNLVFCQPTTPVCELLAFLYRIYTCPRNEMFILVDPEELPYEVQEEVIRIIAELLETQRKSYFVMLTKDRQCLLVQHLTENKVTMLLPLEDDTYKLQVEGEVAKVTEGVHFVHSDCVLSGKTHFIKTCAQKAPDQIYKVLTISGGLNMSGFLEVLSNIFQIEKLFLHIEIEQITPDRISDLDKFLFSLFFFRQAKHGHQLAMYRQNVPIYVEFDSSFIQNAFNDLMITKLGIRAIKHKEDLSELVPRSKLTLEFVRHVYQRGQKKFEFPEGLERARDFNWEEKTFWTNMVKGPLFERETSYIRAQTDMYERIITFVLSLGGRDNSVGQNNQELLWRLINEMALTLSRTAIERIKQQQNETLGLIMKRKLTESELLELESISLDRQMSFSPWKRNDTLFLLIVNNNMIFAYKDSSNFSADIKNFIMQNRNERFNANHEFLMQELLKLNKDPKNTFLCPMCKRIYRENISLCNVCQNINVTNPQPIVQSKDMRKLILAKRTFQPQASNTLISKKDPSSYSKSVEDVYTVTLDNYIKIISIFLRAKARLPVVIMGETGCGKTSLVRFLTTYILDDNVEIFNVHAGITEADIMTQANKLYFSCIKNPNVDHWFIFDEFNTSPACGLIKSIMITRFCGTNAFPQNTIFLATCNPYASKTGSSSEDEFVGLKKKLLTSEQTQYKLQYTVNPIPESLLFYTFNFGQLLIEDEQKYISIWLKPHLNDHNLTVKVAILISDIHKIVKGYFGDSSVSLRDLKRFLKIYQFFNKRYFVEKGNMEENQMIRSLVLALLMCYYVRMSLKERRQQLAELIDKCFGWSGEKAVQMFKEEKKFLIEQLNLESGIVENQALSENIFCLFVCCLNKVPLLICGKPGSSKSLSIKILFSKMKGAKSDVPFFSKFEELVLVAYQGSESSTSRSVERVFEKAEEACKLKDQNKIAVVVFDEIGLAEISKNNPLKVLHFKLEIENIKVGFVGISNWQLDASKMNRVLCLNRRDPDLTELTLTARTIGLSIVKVNRDLIEPKFDHFAIIYHNMRDRYRNNENENIYGLRDFYYLIKGVAKGYKAYSEQTPAPTSEELLVRIYEVAFKSIVKNFNLNNDCWQSMWNEFCKLNSFDNKIWSQIHTPTIEGLISDSLNESDSRPILIITKRVKIHNYIYEILEKSKTDSAQSVNKKFKVMVGSKLANDVSSEDYIVRSINEVILYMDQPVVLIIQQFDGIFTSLYDLFNKNYRKHGNQNYCRIIQGTFGKSSYPVHDQFKVIVFMTQAELQNADIPLINRFEKYFLDSSDDLIQEDKTFQKMAQGFLDRLFPESNEQTKLMEMKRCFANFSQNSLYEWSCQMKKMQNGQNVADFAQFEKLIFQVANLSLCSRIYDHLPSETASRLMSQFMQKKQFNLENLLTKYAETDELTFDFVYTFSGKHLSIEKGFKDTRITELVLETFKDERELRSVLQGFYLSQEKRFLIVKVDGRHETLHMYSLQHLIESSSEETVSRHKHAIVIIYYRQNNIQETDTFYVGNRWQTHFFDNLIKPISQTIREIILEPEITKSLNRFHSLAFENLNTMIDSVFEEANFYRHDDRILSRITTFYANFKEKYGLEFSTFLVDFIFKSCDSDPQLLASINVFDFIKNKANISLHGNDVAEDIELGILSILQKKLSSVVTWIESNMMIGPLTRAIESGNQQLVDFWKRCFLSWYNEEAQTGPRRQMVPVLHVLLFPMSTKERAAIGRYTGEGQTSLAAISDEKQVEAIWQTFKTKDFLWSSFGDEAEAWEEDWYARLLADLVYLEVYEQNEFTATSQDIKELLDMLFQGRVLSLLKMFISDKNAIAYSFLLLNSFKSILGQQAAVIFQTFHSSNDPNVSTDAYLKHIINQLIIFFLRREQIYENFDKLYLEHFRLKRLIQVVEGLLQTKFQHHLELLFWLEVIRLGKQFDSNNSSLKSIIRPLEFNFERIFNDSAHGNQIFQLMSQEIENIEIERRKDLSESIIDFEVFYYQQYLKNNLEVHQQLQAYNLVFMKIEAVVNFHLYTNGIVLSFIHQAKLAEKFRHFGTPSESNYENNNPYLQWLVSNIHIFPKRLPYILMNKLGSENYWKQSASSLFKLDSAFIDLVLKRYLAISPTDNLSLDNILTISLLRLIASEYAMELKQKDLRPEFKYFASAISDKTNPKMRSLHICILKYFGSKMNLSTLKLTDKTLLGYLENEGFKVANAECVQTEGSSYKQFSLILETSHLSIGRRAEEMLLILDRNQNAEHLFSFYLVIINNTQTSLQWLQNYGQQFLEALSQNSARVNNLFGELGFKLLKELCLNFPSNQNCIFKVDARVNEDSVRKNINLLAGFAFWLSQKHSNNYFTNIVFGKPKSNLSIVERLKNAYLPGGVMPGREDLGYMMVVKRGSNRVIYKCSQNCNFFYEFANCQHANSQDKFVPKCMLCGREIGAKTFHGAVYEGQIKLNRDEAISMINGFIKDYLNTYPKGLFDYKRVVSEGNDYDSELDLKTNAIFNFLTNAYVFGLHVLGVEKEKLQVLFNNEDPEKYLQNRIADDFRFIKTLLPKTNVHIMINLMIDKINACGMVTDDANVSLLGNLANESLYHMRMVMFNVQRHAILAIYQRPFQSELEYKQQIFQTSSEKKNSSIAPVIEEVVNNEELFSYYQLMQHLRVAPKEMALYQFFESFDSKFEQYQANFPLTKFFKGNIGQLNNIKLVLMFKEFYDIFCGEFDGKVLRSEAESVTIDQFLSGKPQIKSKYAEFEREWNALVDRQAIIQYECQEVSLRKLDPSQKLIRILPTLTRDNESSDICIALNSFIVYQNKIIDTLGSILTKNSDFKTPQMFNWKHVSTRTLFIYSEKDITNFLNQECLKSSCEWGELGNSDFNFNKFEQHLTEWIFELNSFIFPIIPEFNYVMESSNMDELLIKIRGSNFQLPFNAQSETIYRERLDPRNYPHRQTYLNDIWRFLETMLLPRAIFMTLDKVNLTVQQFMQELLTRGGLEKIPSVNLILDLPMNLLYSFTMMVELMIYRSLFEDTDVPMTRLDTDGNSNEWKSLEMIVLDDIQKCQLYAVYGRQIVTALCRVVLRTTFNNQNLEADLVNYLLYSDIVWDVNFDASVIEGLVMNEKIKLRHALLVVKLLKQEQNRTLNVRVAEVKSRFANVDLEDR